MGTVVSKGGLMGQGWLYFLILFLFFVGQPTSYAAMILQSTGFAESTVSASPQLYEIRIPTGICRDFQQSDLVRRYCEEVALEKNQASDDEPVHIIGLSLSQQEALRESLRQSSPAGTYARYEKIINKTRYAAAVSATFLAMMTRLPEGFTQWHHEDNKNALKRWQKNASSLPVWDHDSPLINFIGHPLSGSAYYTLARQSGLNKTESFIYSVLMSTILWEYGLEATQERPSIQDLIFTPVIGSMVGEVSYQMMQKIAQNHGCLLGSKTLGTIATSALAPLDFAVKILEGVVVPIGDRFQLELTFSYGPALHREKAGPLEENDNNEEAWLHLKIPL